MSFYDSLDGLDDLLAEQNRIDAKTQQYYAEQENAQREKISDNLCRFISRGDKEGLLEYVKTHQIDPETFEPGSWSEHPLDDAARCGQIEMYYTLTELGFTTDDQLYCATKYGQVELVKTLIDKCGVDPTVREVGIEPRDEYVDMGISLSPLLAVVECEYPDRRETLARLLISRGADVNANDGINYTALHMAAKNLDHVLSEIFLDAGADVNARNDRDETPLLLAAERDLSPINEYLEPHSRELLTIKLLVSRGADLKAEDKKGKTVLHCASSSPVLLHYLLVDLNLSPDDCLNDLFERAFKDLYPDSVSLLLELGY